MCSTHIEFAKKVITNYARGNGLIFYLRKTQPFVEQQSSKAVYDVISSWVGPLALLRKMRAFASEKFITFIIEQVDSNNLFSILKKQKLGNIFPCIIRHDEQSALLFEVPFDPNDRALSITFFEEALNTYNQTHNENLSLTLDDRDIVQLSKSDVNVIYKGKFVINISRSRSTLSVFRNENPFHFHTQSENSECVYPLNNQIVLIDDAIRCDFKVFESRYPTNSYECIGFYSTKSPEAIVNTYLSIFGQVNFLKNHLMKFPETDFNLLVTRKDNKRNKCLTILLKSFYDELKTTSCTMVDNLYSNSSYERTVDSFLATEIAKELSGLFIELRSCLCDSRNERGRQTIEQLKNYFVKNPNRLSGPYYGSELLRLQISKPQNALLFRLFAEAEIIRCSYCLFHDNPYEMLNAIYILLFVKFLNIQQNQAQNSLEITTSEACLKETAMRLNEFSEKYLVYIKLIQLLIKDPLNTTVLKDFFQQKEKLFKIFIDFKASVDNAHEKGIITSDEYYSVLGILFYMRATFFDLNTGLVEAAKRRLFSTQKPDTSYVSKRAKKDNLSMLLDLYSDYYTAKLNNRDKDFIKSLPKTPGRSVDKKNIELILSLDQSGINEYITDNQQFYEIVNNAISSEEEIVFSKSKKIMGEIARKIFAIPDDDQQLLFVKKLLSLWLVSLTSHGMYKAKICPPVHLESVFYNPHLIFMLSTILIEDSYKKSQIDDPINYHKKNLELMRNLETKINSEEWIKHVFGIPVVDLTQPLNYADDSGFPFEEILGLGNKDKISFSVASNARCYVDMSTIHFSEFVESTEALGEIVIGKRPRTDSDRNFYDSPANVSPEILTQAIRSFVMATNFHITLGNKSKIVWAKDTNWFLKTIRQRFINGTIVFSVNDQGMYYESTLRPKILSEETVSNPENMEMMESIIGAILSSTVKNWVVIDSILDYLKNN